MVAPVFEATRRAEEDGCNRVWALMGPKKSLWEVYLWGAEVEESESPWHMCAGQREEHDAVQLNELPEQTLTSRWSRWLC